jgi:hypothetical protein
MEWQVVGFCLVPLDAFTHAQERVCLMNVKATGCKACRFRSCCDLAERNARLWLQGKLTKQRFDELTLDLHNTCQIATIYQDWLVKSDLPFTTRRFHMRCKDRKKLLQQCLAIH